MKFYSYRVEVAKVQYLSGLQEMVAGTMIIVTVMVIQILYGRYQYPVQQKMV